MVSQLPFLQRSSPFATEQPELSTDKSGYVTSLLKTFHKLLSTWIRNLNCLPETMWTLPDLALSNPIFYSSAPHSLSSSYTTFLIFLELTGLISTSEHLPFLFSLPKTFFYSDLSIFLSIHSGLGFSVPWPFYLNPHPYQFLTP